MHRPHELYGLWMGIGTRGYGLLGYGLYRVGQRDYR
jgi:hypothetical protein